MLVFTHLGGNDDITKSPLCVVINSVVTIYSQNITQKHLTVIIIDNINLIEQALCKCNFFSTDVDCQESSDLQIYRFEFMNHEHQLWNIF